MHEHTESPYVVIAKDDDHYTISARVERKHIGAYTIDEIAKQLNAALTTEYIYNNK